VSIVVNGPVTTAALKPVSHEASSKSITFETVSCMSSATTFATGLGSSSIGFGCAGLMAKLNRRQSLRLLETAFDSGITYFDTARLYGYGEAESVLGVLLAGRRDQITVATKIGILPPRRSPILSAAKAVARSLADLHPSLRRAVSATARAMMRAPAFDIPTVTRSLETSLRELNTDYVDLLLLHDCELEDLRRLELLDFLERCRRAGKVRHFGIASSVDVAVEAVASRSIVAEIVQIPDSLWEPSLHRIKPFGRPVLVTHSALGADFAALSNRLASDPLRASRWSRKLDLDATDRGALARLFLAHALTSNPNGILLVSSKNPEHIRSNASVAADVRRLADRFPAVEALVAEDIDLNRALP
jgi:D-threo-aldose 1-dehydrogenase